MAGTDPYYWSRDMMQLESQRKALGQSRGFGPSELSEIVRANFNAQQEAEKTYLAKRGQALAEEKQTNAEMQQAVQQGQASDAARAGTYASGATLAVNTPLAYSAGKSAGFWGAPAVAGTQGGITATGTGVATTGAGAGTGTAAGLSTGQAAVTGASAGTAATEGAVTTAGTSALGYGAVGAGSYLGYEAGSHLIQGKHSKQAGIAGSTAAGAAIGTYVVPGIGTAVGAALGAVVGLISSGSIICTELNRQGYISDSMLRASTAYVKKYGDKEGYIGYLIFASPIVEAMKKSKIITLTFLPYGRIMCRECAGRMQPDKYKSTIFSRLVYKTSEKFYRMIFKAKVFSLEVQHG